MKEMEAPVKRRFRLVGGLISLAIIVGALAFAGYAWRQFSEAPTSDDASIDADVVHVAAADSPIAAQTKSWSGST